MEADKSTIPALEHELDKVEAKAATASADGNTEYWTCSVCGKHFADAKGKTEISLKDTVIPKGTVTETPGGSTSGGDSSGGGTSAGSTPGGSASGGAPSTGNTSGGNPSTGNTSGGNPSTGGTSGGNPSTGGTSGGDAQSGTGTGEAAVKVNETFEYKNAQYKVTATANGNYTLTYTKNLKTKAKSATIPNTVVYGGMTFKVTEIAEKAFNQNTRLKIVTIGTNVTSIDANAFNGCKSLKTIKVKSMVLKKVGKNALKGIHKNCKIKVPKAKLKDYKKLFKKKGQKSSVKITK